MARERHGEAEKVYMQEFGARLRAVRQAKQMSQAQVDAVVRSGGGRTKLSLYESGKRLPSVITLLRLARVLDVSVSWLLKGPKKEQA